MTAADVEADGGAKGQAQPENPPSENPPPQPLSWRQSLTKVTTWLALLALGMILGGTVWIWIYSFSAKGPHCSYVGVGMLTAMAAALAGFFAGFLVGVPKVVSSGQARASTGGFSPSTNLAEISDWLTKLLLGAGLVSLSRLGGPIGKLIDDVASGLHSPAADAGAIQSAKVVAGATMAGFVFLGILGGYIVTSTWFQKKISELGTQGP